VPTRRVTRHPCASAKCSWSISWLEDELHFLLILTAWLFFKLQIYLSKKKSTRRYLQEEFPARLSLSRREDFLPEMASLKSVLITGCSDGGIGSALAAIFHERGCHVFATARDISKMSALAGLQNTTLLALDVGDSEQISTAVEAIKNATCGTLDILINNAGRNHFSPVLDIDIAAAKKVYETNLWGPLAMIQAFAPLVIKAKGTIVSITSISGYVNVPHMGESVN